jgi:hypothetical protein
VSDTLNWLAQPARWDAKPLARIQFAGALLTAGSSAAQLREAADLIVADQLPDGHWRVDEETGAGSPATYGPALGTLLAIRIVEQAGSERYGVAIQRAKVWLQARKADHPLDLAARVWAFRLATDADRLVALQAPNGSWNSEPFDTSIAVIALSTAGRAEASIERGLQYLRASHLEPGGWPATTRPPGGDSYAQHVSTSAWALMALLVSSKQ